MANFQNQLSGFNLFMVFTPPFNFGDSIVDIVIIDFWIILLFTLRLSFSRAAQNCFVNDAKFENDRHLHCLREPVP